jgi:hypothetical protein
VREKVKMQGSAGGKHPSGAEALHFFALIGTTEVVPFQSLASTEFLRSV